MGAHLFSRIRIIKLEDTLASDLKESIPPFSYEYLIHVLTTPLKFIPRLYFIQSSG